ncbi:hypothetical protein FPQ18DRAFT_424125 [Pyronema domesticum]|nr:hypothetical protein FPQ18DRAFT_424125 [Pyronema domesticum]
MVTHRSLPRISQEPILLSSRCPIAYTRHLNEHVTSKSHGENRNNIRKNNLRHLNEHVTSKSHGKNKPRRRPEDIKCIYKCGWNDCDKAYARLNHLNVHMVMNNHGVKLTAEDGRKIREEWKKKKKEEEEEAVKEMKCKKENGCG